MKPPRKAERYCRLRAIGEGAYGKAFLVKDLRRDGAECVIKTIDVTDMNKREREACITEVKLLAQLEYPFIVRYLDSFVEGDHLNIVMSHCPDGDLASVIRARKRARQPFSEEQIMRWLAQMLMALKHIHSQRIIHRDIKSQNLLVDSDKRLRLADFGISKLLDQATALAQTFIGTPSYLSPELCLGERYGAATDIWSVGCVVYEIATFRTPFHMAETIPDLFFKINAMPIPSLPSRYSAELQALLDRMLVRDPHKRATATQLLQTSSLQGAIKSMLEEARARAKISAQNA